ncbi:MAG: PhzF family phenazine biosynthesis protein [Tissierellia bacterium]|nr:PhzF family phenazine biosynthesis protein [Tissierellia bacterium]
MEVAIVKSFSYEGGGGNGAGVVILEKQVADEKKQEIACRIGLSETAFVLKRDDNNYDVSFFTPVSEVDLCGHATIAAFYYLAEKGFIKGNNETKVIYQNTKAGRLKINLTFKDGVYVLMQQTSPRIYNDLRDKIKQIAKSLNLDERHMGLEGCQLYPTIVSTGLKDIMIPVKSRDILNSINANFKAISKISKENNVIGYHVFTIDEGTIYARNFAPLVGIDEECATGTSNGALASLLYSRALANSSVEIIQGEAMNEKSMVFVKINEVDNILDVYVGGKAFIENYLEI